MGKASNRTRVMLDSGAFSAWNRGEKIELKEYIKFLKDNQSLLDSYINLDVIPGRRGVQPTNEEVAYAADASLDNYKSMRAEGLRPIPVFHFGESFSCLEKLVEAGADYICLGGTVGTMTPDKRLFFDKCFTMLTNAQGRPIVKVHGLGVSEGKFVTRYPWYSVDSTSWAIAPIYGMILAPPFSKNFSAQIYVADGTLDKRSSSRLFEKMPTDAQNHILQFIEDECGLTMTDLRNDVYARTITFIRTLQLMRAPLRFKGKVGSFTMGRPYLDSPAIVPKFRMIFASNISHRQGWLLVRCKARDRLLSYADLKKNASALPEYVKKGVAGHLNKWPDPNERAKPDWKSLSYHEDRRKRLVRRKERNDEGENDQTETT